MRVEIRSRAGNVVIGALGIVYAIAAAALFVTHFLQTLGAASLMDRAIQLLLLLVLAVSLWFIAVARRGLQRSGASQSTVTT